MLSRGVCWSPAGVPAPNAWLHGTHLPALSSCLVCRQQVPPLRALSAGLTVCCMPPSCVAAGLASDGLRTPCLPAGELSLALQETCAQPTRRAAHVCATKLLIHLECCIRWASVCPEEMLAWLIHLRQDLESISSLTVWVPFCHGSPQYPSAPCCSRIAQAACRAGLSLSFQLSGNPRPLLDALPKGFVSLQGCES